MSRSANRNIRCGVLAMAVASLSACGGGGASSLGGVSSTSSAPTVTVTEANANQLAVMAVTLDTSSMNVGSSLVGIANTNSGANRAVMMSRVQGQARQLLAMAGNTLYQAAQTATRSCAYGGSITLSANLASSTAISAGDTISATYNSCATSSTTSMNGSVTLDVTAWSGDMVTAPYSASMTITFNDLKSSSGSDYVLMNGSATLSTGDDGSVTSTRMSGSSMAQTAFISGQTSSMALSNFDIVSDSDNATLESTDSLNYTVDSTALGGTMTVATEQPFKTAWGSSNPYQGVLTVTGANSTKVRLTAYSDATTVLIEGDFNGDGSYEYSNETTWSAL